MPATHIAKAGLEIPRNKARIVGCMDLPDPLTLFEILRQSRIQDSPPANTKIGRYTTTPAGIERSGSEHCQCSKPGGRSFLSTSGVTSTRNLSQSILP